MVTKEVMKIEKIRKFIDIGSCKWCLEQLEIAKSKNATHVVVCGGHVISSVDWNVLEKSILFGLKKILTDEGLLAYKNIFEKKIKEALEMIKNE